MLNKKLLKHTLILILIATIASVLSYYFLDRQLATWLQDHGSRGWVWIKVLHPLAEIPGIIAVYSALFYIYVAIRVIQQRWTSLDQKLLLFANCIAISYFIVGGFLKIICGRLWPATFIGNISYLDHHAYGFYFFQGFNPHYRSFPSGHTITAVAIATILWHLVPRLRWLWVALACFVPMMMVVQNFHFVSDVIFGALTGYLAPTFIYQFSQLKNNATL